MYKIYESDNYIVVTKVENGETFYGHKKNVFIDKNNTNKPFYSIFNVKDFKEDTVLKIGEIQKQDGTLYTEAEFDTFYRTNTGNFNGGGTAPYIPLAGTEVGSLVTGNIEFQGAGADLRIFSMGDSDILQNNITFGDGVFAFGIKNLIDGGGSSIQVNENYIGVIAQNDSVGIKGSEDFTPNITDLDYTQKRYVDTKAIPITGTQVGNPVTGEIEMQEIGNNFWINGANSPDDKNSLIFSEGGVYLDYTNTASSQNITLLVGAGGVSINDNSLGSKGITSGIDYSPNITDLDYTQKIYVDERGAVSNATTVVLSASDLNTAYPNAKDGFRVFATDIIAGGKLYHKIGASWVSQEIALVV